MTTTGILPTYQRFVNGVPVPFSRRYFRPREKYVILLAVLTFGLVFFGTFFFLPEFRGTNNAADSVYKVYDQIKRAGPELLIPPPPYLSDSKESLRLMRHDDDSGDLDPHVLDDREKLKAKIDLDGELKVLERPDMGLQQKTSSTASKPNVNLPEPNAGGGDLVDEGVPQESRIVTVPPALSDHYPLVTRGEDSDPVTKERRNKVKEVRRIIIVINYITYFLLTTYNSLPYTFLLKLGISVLLYETVFASEYYEHLHVVRFFFFN